jgi:Icc protein
VLIAQITDTHIRPKGKLLHHMVHTARYLRRAVQQLEAFEPRPDVVVATGDLVERGKPKEYRRLRAILAPLSIPLLVIPGNHDDRAAFRAAFADHAYLPDRGPMQYAIETPAVRLIGLDTTRPGHSGGELDDARLDWFETMLAAAPHRPTFVFMHHPPFDLGIAPLDALGFTNRDRFAAIVARNPQIVHIAAGHVHRRASTRIGTTRVTTAPSTAHQLVIDRSESGSTYGLRLETPGFALHAWDGRSMTTSIRTVEALAVRNLPRLAAAS